MRRHAAAVTVAIWPLLRTLAAAFDIPPTTLVSGIVFNGYVSAKDRATGKLIRPLLISTPALVGSRRVMRRLSDRR